MTAKSESVKNDRNWTPYSEDIRLGKVTLDSPVKL